jgi:heme/copper-type cytochrome/quinol oxidase subunit 1
LRRLPVVLAALGWALLAVGITVFWSANRTAAAADVGWSAYTPLQPGEPVPVLFFGDGTVLWTRGHVMGALLVVVGLLVLAALAGWWLGRRRGVVPPS